jgi:sulfite exporter TauE/SafE
MVTTSLFATLFLSTLVGGWHCALMCGGIAAAMERSRDSEIALVSKSTLFYQQLIMHLGRLTTYVLLGAVAGQIGVIVWQQNVVLIQRPLFALSALILIAMAFRLWRQQQPKPSSSWLGVKAAEVWSKYLGRLASGPARWFSGMLWGLVPCGLVYSVLPLAFLSGSALSGAGLMLAFGLGTLPNLLLISRFSASLVQFSHYAWVRYVAIALLLASGLYGLYRAWVLPQALLQGGFCIS